MTSFQLCVLVCVFVLVCARAPPNPWVPQQHLLSSFSISALLQGFFSARQQFSIWNQTLIHLQLWYKMLTGLWGSLADGNGDQLSAPQSWVLCISPDDNFLLCCPALAQCICFLPLGSGEHTFSTCEGCSETFLPPLEVKQGLFALHSFALLPNINANTSPQRQLSTHLAHVRLCCLRPTDHPQRQWNEVHSDVQVHHTRRFSACQQQQRHPGGHVRVGPEELVPLFQAVRWR